MVPVVVAPEVRAGQSQSLNENEMELDRTRLAGDSESGGVPGPGVEAGAQATLPHSSLFSNKFRNHHHSRMLLPLDEIVELDYKS